MTLLTTLHRDYYTSDSIHHEELNHIFYQRWLCLGRADEIGNPGDYVLKQVGDESLIVARDRGGALHAFYNV